MELNRVAVGVGVGVGVGAGAGVGVGVERTGFIIVPLSQTILFPLLMHVYFLPLKTLLIFNFEQVAPD